MQTVNFVEKIELPKLPPRSQINVCKEKQFKETNKFHQ